MRNYEFTPSDIAWLDEMERSFDLTETLDKAREAMRVLVLLVLVLSLLPWVWRLH